MGRENKKIIFFPVCQKMSFIIFEGQEKLLDLLISVE